MKKTAATLTCIGLVVVLGACTHETTERVIEQPFDFAGTTSFDGEVLRIALDREDGGKERFSTLRDRWFGWTWVPFLPNHSGRRWALRKADQEGVSIAYTLVSWDDDTHTDYLAAGFWLRYDGLAGEYDLPISAADVVTFIDGTEIDPARPPTLPVSGTASYLGEARGLYTYTYGSDWTGQETPEAGEEFQGRMNAEVNFDDMTVAGCIGCIGDLQIERRHLFGILGWRVDEPLASPTDYDIHFAPTAIAPDGSFLGEGVTVTHPERAVTQSGGEWGGGLSNLPAPDGTPRMVAGTTSATFTEDDGSTGSFDAIFINIHPSLVPDVRR